MGAEICEDLWAPDPPSIGHAMAGATVIVNLSASDETTGKDVYRKKPGQRTVGAADLRLCLLQRLYVYLLPRMWFTSGHNLIAENGTVLAESARFVNESIVTELDIQRLCEERRRMSTYGSTQIPYCRVEFDLKETQTELSRFVDPAPFVPGKKEDRDKRCEEIFMIQAWG